MRRVLGSREDGGATVCLALDMGDFFMTEQVRNSSFLGDPREEANPDSMSMLVCDDPRQLVTFGARI